MENKRNSLISGIWTTLGINRHEIRLLAFAQHICLASPIMVHRKGTKMMPHSLKDKKGKCPMFKVYSHLPICQTMSGSSHSRTRSREYGDPALFSIIYIFSFLVVQEPKFKKIILLSVKCQREFPLTEC